MIERNMGRVIQIDSSSLTAVDAINAVVSPVPQTPVSLSAVSTMTQRGPVQIRNMKILSSETVNAMISQQSATNASLNTAEKLARGIVPGTAGVTLQQLTRPGLQMKPGTAEFVQSKLNMGMNFQSAVSSTLLTGNLGAKTVNDVIKNTNAQVTAITTGLKSSANALINKGIISGLEPSTQIGGLVMAANVFGNQTIASIVKDPKNVVNILTGRGTELIGNLKNGITNITSNITGGLDKITSNIKNIGDMISSGNFASGIADKFTSGLSGVASGLSGAVAGAVGKFVGGLFGKSANVSIEQLFSQLKSTAIQAFQTAEQSIKPLNAGVPNFLGEDQAQKSETESEKLVKKLDIARAELELADSDLIQARVSANDQTLTDEERNLRIQAAELRYSKAKQALAQSVSETITPAPKNKGGIFGKLKNAIGDITNIKQGIAAIPGGIGAFANEVVGKGINAFNSIYKSATVISTAYATGGLSLLSNSKIGQEFSKFTDPKRLVGDLVGNASNSLKNITNIDTKISDQTSKAISKLKGTLGSIGQSGGTIKTPTYAIDTDPVKTQIAAKTGQLIENDTCPLPIIFTGDLPIDRTPNEQILAQKIALERIDALEAESVRQELIVQRLFAESMTSPEDSSKMKKLSDARSKLNALEKQISVAQEAYESVIRMG